ncbi:MAG: hypothetical protein WBV77_15875, partial [Solirubrobacteraceae bacterium]
MPPARARGIGPFWFTEAPSRKSREPPKNEVPQRARGDSGTIPALLILEQLSLQGKRLSDLLKPYRQRYFISGEINTEV